MILKSISEGIKFAFSLNTIVPYLVLYLITFYVLISFFSNIVDLIPSGAGIKSLLSLGIYLPILIIIGLIYLWVHGAIVDQAKYYPKRKPLAKSFGYSTSRYLTILCALILYAIIAAIISSPPYIGPLLAIVLNLITFFLYQAIIVDKKGCIESFKKSFNTFMRYPLETFVTWLFMIIITGIIVGIFATPLMIFIFGRVTLTPELANPAKVEPQTILRILLPAISDAVRSPYFIIFVFILCIGLAINSAFQIGTKTRLYINTRKIEV
jgi:hypothetical protein